MHGGVVALFGLPLHGGRHLLVPVVLLCAGLDLVPARGVVLVALVVVGVPGVVQVVVKQLLFAAFTLALLVGAALFATALLPFAQGLESRKNYCIIG